ncbi:MAG: PPOX class F420-dependent oxidoreductase [Acidimicrobiia bacterium]|nr:PPOX class F420-dependent oxidoreductase [Acidimicrobiia bacterium]MDH3462440.1 PPOX class F420-dependent oxidoreductase [Acidimicrobiia bacterium]
MVDVNTTVERFLQERPTATLGTIRQDGSPQASVVWYLWDQGEFVISTIPTTAKWHNLKRDPRCSLCIEDPDSGQMVIAYGSARLDDSDVEPRTRDIVDRYYDDPADTDAHVERIFATGDRVLIFVRPNRLLTRKLQIGG